MDGVKLSPTFLTRDQLAWEKGVAYDIELQILTRSTTPFDLIGVTREGPFRYTVVPNGNGLIEQQIFRIPDIPIFLNCNYPGGSGIRRGETYITVFLRAAETRLFKMTSGYVYTNEGIGWPAINIEPNISGRGVQQRVVGADPAAGSNATIVVPAGEAWLVKFFALQIVTDGTAVSRRLHVQWNAIAGLDTVEFWAGDDQTATQTRNYMGWSASHIQDTLDDTQIFMPMPTDFMMYEGDDLTTRLVNLQAGDNLGPIRLFVEKFLIDV